MPLTFYLKPGANLNKGDLLLRETDPLEKQRVNEGHELSREKNSEFCFLNCLEALFQRRK